MAAPRAVVFDFDGIVLESVQVKLEAFHELYQDAARKREIFEYLDGNNGLSRYIKFKYIAETYLDRRYDDAVEQETDQAFNKLVFDKVMACPFVPGARECLEAAPVPIYVASAQPTRDLVKIAAERGIARLFKKLYGTPGRKADRLREIAGLEGLEPAQMIFVGDSRQDHKHAVEAGVPFVGRNNAEDFSGIDAPIFDDMFGVAGHLGWPVTRTAA